MAKTQRVTPFYLRMQTGECFYVDTLNEALEEFLGDDGYRLTIQSDGQEMVVRRTSEWGDGIVESELMATASMIARKR